MNIRKHIPYKIDWILGNAILAVKMYGKTFAKLLLGRYDKAKPERFRSPKTLQLPITFRCNCDCVMCGMRKMQGRKNFSPEELEQILCSNLFAQITSVGVNGGEPFLEPQLEKYIEILVKKLSKLQHIYIISNGYFTDMVRKKLLLIKGICKEKGVKLHISISVDGIGETHNLVRGIPGIFEKTEATCKMLHDNPELYDSFNCICTLSNYNILEVGKVEAWAAMNGYAINYNMASRNRRLDNDEIFSKFSVTNMEQNNQLCQEFFYGKFLEGFSETYFAIYYFLRYGKRISKCNYQADGVTVTPDGLLAYCATFSDTIGNVIHQDAETTFRENLAYRKELCTEMCSSCSHYMGGLTLEGRMIYIKEVLRRRGNPFWD